MADHAALKHPLRHPAEIPTFVIMVILNVVILAILIDFLVSLTLIPSALRGTNWETTWRAVAAAIILVAPALMIGRQIQRASIRGTAVQLSRTQFPDLYASVGISQLPRSHPWTVRRIWRLHQLKLFGEADTAAKAPRSLDVA